MSDPVKCPICGKYNWNNVKKCPCGFNLSEIENKEGQVLQPKPAPPLTSNTVPIEDQNEKPKHLYRAILGQENQLYYLAKFEQFDQQESSLQPSWNWAAFFGSGFWALYRKMYGWFFAFWGIAFVLKVLDKGGAFFIGSLLSLGSLIAFSIFANSFYHRNVKKRIAIAQLSVRDNSKLLDYLIKIGGVNEWLMWVLGVFIILLIIAIFASIIISPIPINNKIIVAFIGVITVTGVCYLLYKNLAPKRPTVKAKNQGLQDMKTGTLVVDKSCNKNQDGISLPKTQSTSPSFFYRYDKHIAILVFISIIGIAAFIWPGFFNKSKSNIINQPGESLTENNKELPVGPVGTDITIPREQKQTENDIINKPSNNQILNEQLQTSYNNTNIIDQMNTSWTLLDDKNEMGNVYYHDDFKVELFDKSSSKSSHDIRLCMRLSKKGKKEETAQRIAKGLKKEHYVNLKYVISNIGINCDLKEMTIYSISDYDDKGNNLGFYKSPKTNASKIIMNDNYYGSLLFDRLCHKLGQKNDPPPNQSSRPATINPMTGEYLPPAGGGVINPRTGEFHPDVGPGYIRPQTGEFLPKQ